MIIDERARKLMKRLVERSVHPIKELERQTKLSRRQVIYTVEKISDWLMEQGQLKLMVENNQLRISEEAQSCFLTYLENKTDTKDYWMSSEERLNYLFLLLFYYPQEYLSINYFLTEFKVGKTTIVSDLKKLSAQLESYQIKLDYSRKLGYFLSGSETDIRYYLIKMILWDSNSQQSTFIYDHFIERNNIENYTQTKRVIVPLLQKYELSFVENRLTEFIYTFIFLEHRLAIKQTVEHNQYKTAIMLSMKEYQFSEELLKQYGIEEVADCLYLCSWILGLSIGSPDPATKDYEMIMDLVQRIIIRFESLSGIRFSHQTNAIQQLYAHFRPAYYRLYFKLPIVNPLHEKIKEEYKDLFELVEETLRPVASIFEHPIPDDEIAFLTMHFAALCKDSEESKVPKKVALIVCPNGIGSSSILYTELKSLFPELSFIGPIETNQVESYEGSYDIIFSTVPNIRLFYTKKLVYVVSPIMSTAEKYQLISDVYTQIGQFNFRLPQVEGLVNIIEKHAVIKDAEGLEKELAAYLIHGEEPIVEESEEGPALYKITDEELIQLNIKAKNWEEAIRLSAAPLLKKQRITRQYIETIIETAHKEGPYMVIAPHVALPHARPEDGAKKLGISIATLSQPIVFGNKENDPVKYIFCLSAPKNNRHLNAMAELVHLLDDPLFYTCLESSSSPQEVYNYIYEQALRIY